MLNETMSRSREYASRAQTSHTTIHLVQVRSESSNVIVLDAGRSEDGTLAWAVFGGRLVSQMMVRTQNVGWRGARALLMFGAPFAPTPPPPPAGHPWL